ncbi:hypothetical protein [Sphingobium baderi]|uniref:hypothetical protein n=1 Tax=Sphingobium baderi TaxID=1332080 RepID=UPI002B408FF2|nr:hypothetical protein [Sphingobium baderi]WRD78802.1 hypothetical protein QQ987_19145 [Sphingobium baderi]
MDRPFGVEYPNESSLSYGGARLSDKGGQASVKAPCGDRADTQRRLQIEPLSPEALWCWSLIKEDKGDEALQMASRLSRRNMQVQAALLKSAAERGDAAGALGHMDKMLRVFPEAGAKILPDVAPLMGMSGGRTLLAPYVNRPWFLPLIGHAVRGQVDIVGIADMLTDRKREGGSLPKDIIASLIARMLQQNRLSAATSWAAQLNGAPVSGIDQFGLSPLSADQSYAPLTWKIPVRADVSGTYRSDGVLEFLVAPDSFLNLLERTTAYPRGNYRFRQKAKTNSGALELEWIMHCNRSGPYKSLWRKDLAEDPANEEKIPVKIDGDCPQQTWILRANTGPSVLPMKLSIQFANLEIAPR